MPDTKTGRKNRRRQMENELVMQKESESSASCAGVSICEQETIVQNGALFVNGSHADETEEIKKDSTKKSKTKKKKNEKSNNISNKKVRLR